MHEIHNDALPYRELAIDENLSLRQLDSSEAAEVFALVDQNRDYLSQWLPWVDFTQTATDSESFINETLRKRREGSEYGYAIIHEGRPVGHISLMHVTDEKDPEIGYWVSSDVSGKGITTRAAGALTNFGFQTLGLQKIVIKAEPGNIGSNKVAEKLGYVLDGVATAEDNGRPVNVWSKLPDTPQ